jgi:putative oxidoreductase
VSSNPVYAFFATPKNFGPLILRLMVATIFIYHGGQKAFGWWDGKGWSGTLQDFSGMGFPAPIGVCVMLTEVLVSIAMVFGFLTRLAAFGAAVVMAGALYFVHAGQGWNECEFPFAILMAAFALLFLGAGRVSIDRMISGQLLPTIGGY